MRRKRVAPALAVLLLLGPAGIVLASLQPLHPKPAEPAVRLFSGRPLPLGDRPTKQELALFESLEGKSTRQVRKLLGDPHGSCYRFAKDETEEDAQRQGCVVWEYDWRGGGRGFVFIRHGVVQGTWYLPPNIIAQVPCD